MATGEVTHYIGGMLQSPARNSDGSLREQVVEHVRTQIISGQHEPDALYSVPSLAARLGVSTTPVREALLELARAGLIEPMRNRGFRVVEPTLTQLRNLFDMRDLLELHAAELVALKRKKDLAPLRVLAEAVGQAVDAGDIAGYLRTDRSFHQAFTAEADNELLTTSVMALRDNMRLYGITSEAGLERQRQSVAEHFQLIDLAEIGDAEGLKALLRHHIRSWQPIFTQALLEAKRERAPATALPRR